MIEDPVQDHTDPSPVRLADQVREQPVARLEVRRIRHTELVFAGLCILRRPTGQDLGRVVHYFAKVGVDVAVILRVVLVVGGRDEDRIEVDRVDPQLVEVIELVDDALQVSAVVLARVITRWRTVPVVDVHDLSAVVGVLAGHDVVARVAVAEPVREDLVHHRALGPLRHPELRVKIPPPVRLAALRIAVGVFRCIARCFRARRCAAGCAIRCAAERVVRCAAGPAA